MTDFLTGILDSLTGKAPIGKSYYKKFRGAFPLYHPNPIPLPPVSVGDYGWLKDGFFEKKANLHGLDVDFAESGKSLNREISFQEACDNTFAGNGEMRADGVVDGSMSFSFRDKNAFYFHSVIKSNTKIARLDETENQLLDLLKAGSWKASYVLVTEILQSQNTVLALAGEEMSTVLFNCQADSIPLQTAGRAGFSLKNQTKGAISCYTNGSEEVIPGFKLVKFKWWSKELRSIAGESDASGWEDPDSDEYDPDYDYQLSHF